MSQHSQYKYSITIFTDDLPLVHCLRGLTQYSERTWRKKISWGNTKESDWVRAGHCVTFRFSMPEYREGFRKEVDRLLPNNLWLEKDRSDNDPASPAS